MLKNQFSFAFKIKHRARFSYIMRSYMAINASRILRFALVVHRPPQACQPLQTRQVVTWRLDCGRPVLQARLHCAQGLRGRFGLTTCKRLCKNKLTSLCKCKCELLQITYYEFVGCHVHNSRQPSRYISTSRSLLTHYQHTFALGITDTMSCGPFTIILQNLMLRCVDKCNGVRPLHKNWYECIIFFILLIQIIPNQHHSRRGDVGEYYPRG